MPKKKRRPGRPSVPAEERRDIRQSFRTNAEEDGLIADACEELGVSRMTWLRETIMRAAKRALRGR